MTEHLDVKVARIDERLFSLTEDFKEYKGESKDLLTEISRKVGAQNATIQKFKRDRNWVAGIAGVLYTTMLAWLEYRLRG